jgi:hypothetical protein
MIRTLFPSLNTLDLSQSNRLTKISVQKLRGLETLYCGHTSFLNNEILTSLGRSCVLLRVLDIGQPRGMPDAIKPMITDAGIINLTKYCPLLQEINISYMSRDAITDASVISISQRCPDLQIIYISGNNLVTDYAVPALVSGCSYLKEFHGSFCPNITDAGVLLLVQGARRLDRITMSSPISRTIWNNIKMLRPLAVIRDDHSQIMRCRCTQRVAIKNMAIHSIAVNSLTTQYNFSTIYLY